MSIPARGAERKHATVLFADIVGFDAGAEQVVGLFWYGWPATVTNQMRRPLERFVVHVA